jgi:hypothetical protein
MEPTSMERTFMRRLALALPFAIPALAAVDAIAAPLASESIASPDTEPVNIEGLDQIVAVLASFVVKTACGREARFSVGSVADDEGVQIVHRLEPEYRTANVPIDPYATLPTWLQRELSFAALAATQGGAQ